ncbi:MAG: histidine kinase [Streptosporangiales bacterium]|nr:histidine kinase [Streptosporangiales bacterium]
MPAAVDALNPFAVARRRRDWAVDSVVSAVALSEVFWSATVFADLYRELPTWWVGLDLAVGALAAPALWWRRRYPLALAIVLAPIGGLFMSAGVAGVVSVYTVAASRRFAVALLVTVVHMVIAIPYYFLVPLAPGLLPWLVVMVLIYGTALSVGLAVRSRRQVILGLIASAERDRADYERRLHEVRRAEREQIAREMHDVLAHRISLLSVHAGALEFRTRAAKGGRPLTEEEVGDAAAVIRESSHLALEDLQQVLTVLNGDGGNDPGPGELGTDPPPVGIADLPDLIHEAALAGQVVHLRQQVDHDLLTGLARSAQRTVFRAVQEGLTNARKHTPGTQVEVDLSGSPGTGLTVRISNALPIGATRAEIPGAGSGLTGLTERVRLDGGILDHDVRDGRFVLTIGLPWRT